MKNSEILNYILTTLEKDHKNLYHSVSKQEIEDYINSIPNIDELSDFRFDYEMRKLFAKFKDAHTQYSPPNEHIDKKLVYVQGKMYVKDGDVYKGIKSLGGLDHNEVIKKLAEMQYYETKAWLNYCIDIDINNWVAHAMINTVNKDGTIDCVVDNKGKEEKIKLSPISYEKYVEKGLSNKKPIYDYEILGNNVLRVNYRKCEENPDYPFSNFVEDIKRDIQQKNITQFVLDLRGNTGGHSGIICPLTQTFKELNLKGAVLIDNGVFSSGRWAVIEFKRELDALLIGEPTGGALASYGYREEYKFAGKTFSASIDYFDFSNEFGYKGSIRPDIEVTKTIQDFKNNIDRPLAVALNELSKEITAEVEI